MDMEKFKMGWLVVAFDLPVLSKPQRKAATAFRDFLIDDGFQMMQFSVYVRPCVSFARQETHIDRIRKSVPAEASTEPEVIEENVEVSEPVREVSLSPQE